MVRLACVPECPVRQLDAQAGVRTSGTGAVKRKSAKGSVRSTSIGAESRPEGMPMICYGDTGGVSRYFPVFYCAKAPKSERTLPDGTRTDHPTVKNVALMRWLVRLVTPPGGTVLDCFMGTGSTGVACREEGLDFFGIERDENYVAFARGRLGAENVVPEVCADTEDSQYLEFVRARLAQGFPPP